MAGGRCGAAGLAARVPIGALALEAPYVSMTAVAKTRYWWLPVDMLIRNPIHAGAAIRNYRGPVLMFHGDRDTIIPLPIGRRLYEMANEPKEFVLVPGGDHFIFTEDTFAHELVFFDRHLGHLPADQ